MSVKRFGARLWYGLVLALALIGCDSTYCTTKLGMRLSGNPDNSNWDCARLNNIESQLAERLPYPASRLQGYVVVLHPALGFVDPWGRTVGGYTMCPVKEMHIGQGKTVFAHEVVHALQDCQPRHPAEDGLDWDHANWQIDSLYKTIEEVSQ